MNFASSDQISSVFDNHYIPAMGIYYCDPSAGAEFGLTAVMNSELFLVHLENNASQSNKKQI